jgi:hypothetical protein
MKAGSGKSIRYAGVQRENKEREREKKKEENPFWYPMPGPFLVYN